MTNSFQYLALGDSYTIGESVLPAENFPNQVKKLFTAENIDLNVTIIAKTGWTTDELKTGIAERNEQQPLSAVYDFVSLLIGVNNQYRGRPVSEFENGFRDLLDDAIAFAGNDAGRVTVLSIPDWGVTPFAEGRDREKIAEEINAYNHSVKLVTKQRECNYLDITPWTREAAADPGLITSDGLHPSAREYSRWAVEVKKCFSRHI